MTDKAYILNEFSWLYRKNKYEDHDDFRQNAKHRDGIVAVATDPMRWNEEWGAPIYLVTRFDSDDFVEHPGFFCCDGDFNFVGLYHYQYYVEEFIYGIRKIEYNIAAIISHWEGMCEVYNDLLKSREAGGLGLKYLLKEFEPLNIKNERNWELCRIALSGEKSDHKYPVCDKRFKFGECEASKDRIKCLQLLDENKCPLGNVWKNRIKERIHE